MNDINVEAESKRQHDIAMWRLILRYMFAAIVCMSAGIATCDAQCDTGDWEARARACEQHMKAEHGG